MGRHRCLFRVPLERFKSGDAFEKRIESRSVVFVVGGDAQKTSGLEPRGQNLQEHRVEEPALPLSLLGPRVGEVDVEGPYRLRRQRALDEVAGVRARGVRVGEARFRDAVPAEAVVGKRQFDPEEVVRAVAAGRFDQEPRLPASDLNLQGSPAAEVSLRIKKPTGPNLFVRRRGESRPGGINRTGSCRRSAQLTKPCRDGSRELLRARAAPDV